jgi:large subunit ribosomal protein L1
MPVSTENILKAIKQMREAGKKRKFEQSVDLVVVLEGIDPKKPEGRITEDVLLPHQFGKPKKILVFADGELARRARDAGADLVLSRDDVEALGREKKKAKKLGDEYDFLIAQADFMVLIGKMLGGVLGPRGKMPKPIPSTADPKPIIDRMKKTVRLVTKDQAVLQIKIGLESMSDEQLAENARTVLDAVERKLGEGAGSIREVQIKTTMGKPVKLEV